MPIAPEEIEDLKRFTKEENAIFDFIVSPEMQKYLKNFKRQVLMYKKKQIERQEDLTGKVQKAFDTYQVNFLITEVKEDD